MKKAPLLICVFFLLKTISFSQTLEFGIAGGAIEYDQVTDVVCLSNGNVVVTGWFGGIVDFDPGPGVNSLSSPTYENTFVACYSDTGSLLWVKELEATLGTYSFALTTDANDNIYIIGVFEATIDMDPSPGVFNMTASAGRYDTYILKLNSAGSFAWAGQIGNLVWVDYNYGTDIDWDGTNGIAITGAVDGSVDLDPTPGTYFLPPVSTSYEDAFVIKMDTSGAFLWGCRFGGIYATLPQAIHFDNSGDIWSSGIFVDDIDLNPGVGTDVIPESGTVTSYIQKLDGNTGNYMWGGSLRSTDLVQVNSIASDDFSNMYFGGYHNASTDMNPGAGAEIHPTAGGDDLFVLKLHTDGTFQWAGTGGGLDDNVLMEIDVDTSGSIYGIGTTAGASDFDPGSGSYPLASAGGLDFFLFKWTTLGALEWAVLGGGASDEHGRCVDVSQNGNIFAGGNFNGTTDLDPGADTAVFVGAGSEDFFLLSLGDDMVLFTDSLAGVSCISSGYISVIISGGVTPYSYLWSTGDTTTFIHPDSAGMYSVSVTDSAGSLISRSYLITAPLFPSGFDLEGGMACSSFRPGSSGYLFLDAWNTGCSPVSGEVSLVLNPDVSFISSVPMPSGVSGDTVIWNFSGLNYDSPHVQITVEVIVSTTVISGDTLCFDLKITPVSGDEFPLNNVHVNECYPVIGSYDPNDKQVYPRGECTEHFVHKNTPLNYTIRFQNTGTAEAINVYILDTLDEDIDLSSVHIKAHSHPMWTEVLPGNVLKFVFNNIYLPDSTSDEAGSHGYVIYDVQPDAGLSDGTQIYNGSAIFFDYNEPVLTNVVMNTLVDSVPPCLPDADVNMSSGEGFNIYPNPAQESLTISGTLPLEEIRILNTMGQEVRHICRPAETDINLNISGLPSGVYFLTVQNGGKTLVKKLLIE